MRALSRKVSRLQAKIKAAADKFAVVLDVKMHDDIQAIMHAVKNSNIMSHQETLIISFGSSNRKLLHGCSDDTSPVKPMRH